jgi:outer membrane receptor protein involved in Fe transport
MQPIGRAGRFGVAVLALLVTGTGVLGAQGVTSAAVQGRVTSEARGNVQSAIVVLTNTSTGARQQTTTNAAGRYNIENTTPGGPYTVEVRAIGFQPASKTGIMLSLGQRYTQDFELAQQVVTLEELTVVSATDPLINSGRTGPAQTVTDTAIQRLPLLGRNFISLLNTSPQVVPTQGGGLSIAGQNNRFNTILIDGGTNNDVFGLAASGTPGGQAGAKPISLEALQEFQILVAPFDIRQGSFSGGLVNGITKSGSNRLFGSLFGYLQRPELVGVDTTPPPNAQKVTAFEIKQYGATIGGPIIKNRLHFFASADIQSSSTEFFGAEAAEPSTGISVLTAERVRDIIQTKYGFDPGGVDKPVLDRPDKNLFGKLTLQLGGSSLLDLSHNYVKAQDDNFLRGVNQSSRNRTDRDGWMLSNSGYFFQSITNSTRAKLTSLIGNANFEALVGYQTVRDGREIPNRVPLLLIQGDQPNNYIAAGGEKFSQANTLDQDVIEATANLTFGMGRNHQITVGTHNEFFKFNNVFFAGSLGVWTFGSADSLDLGEPNRYELAIETRPGGATADFSVKQFGGYLQDAWRPNDRLTLTAGLRFDVPTSGSPVENELTQLVDSLGVNTGRFPSGNVLWSPRLGFNWDPRGNGNTIVRGGVGIFSGRPPYVWLSNAFTNTGKEQVVLICTGPAATPAFTVDPDNLPTACVGGSGPPTPPAANINYFDEDFKFQQALKYSIGLDQRLPWGVVATLDFLYTAAKNQMYQLDDNVLLGAVNGEGRQLYATPNTAGTALTRLTKTAAVRQVVRHENRSADKAYNFTAQLQKAFSNGVAFSAAYTYSNAKDLITLTSSVATSNLANTSLDGTLENRNLRTSGLDVPHKITLSGSADLAFGIQGSVIYNGRSGTPYTYTVTGDANGDAITVNDIMYVPTDINDITLPAATAVADWDRLNTYIASEPCLRSQRGRIMERNTCRNPWVSFVNVRLAKIIPTRGGQSLEISSDVFNLLNLLDRSWGIVRENQGFEERPLLAFAGYDTRGTPSQADDRGRYTVPTLATLPPLNRAQVAASRWRIQLGAKYTF